ncbi:MAG: hypothetical protein COS41_00305 [Elusimicrobia bacterium CG03_land_8_20_14_0_80_50_18]|nr:MAG: hypothetical protein COS41_00305 [Elusimicrobia bacterium CG03_land_8_20_14_0_80_50_18]PIX15873.1 MAG: hypothetical protein COZ72_02440 [Elusimicrobia bacterium CG_4_8_14_3_um_filter_50_9]
MFSIRLKDFNFEKIFNSGLFYFFYDSTPKRRIPTAKKIITLSFAQNRNILRVDTSSSLDDDEEKSVKKRLRYCFGADENMDEFYSLCSRDRVLKNFLPRIKGTRIISAYSDFEALVGAVVSQNNSYMHYRAQMLRLCSELNFKRENYLGNLDKFRLGYKSAYLKNLAEGFGRTALEKIKGIGAYSLNLFEIFQKRNYSAFYIDCLTEKIMRESYRAHSDLDEASKKLWGKWRGLALAYLQRFFEQKPQNA